MDPLSPQDQDRARELLKNLSDLKEKAELLSEHVENRKSALEEEIEESLHEAIANARDSLERVYENIEPKLENTIREKLDEIKIQMDSWKKDARHIVRQEIDAKADDMTQTLLDGLEARIQERTDGFMAHMKEFTQEQIQKETEARLKESVEKTAVAVESIRSLTLAALGAGVLALLVGIVAMFL